MRLLPGTVAFYRQAFDGGVDKFIYILGVLDPPGADGEQEIQQVLWFTISSRTKWTTIRPHCNEMVEIPLGTAEYLDRVSFIQCFHEVHRTPLVEFRERENRAYLMYRGHLPQFISAILGILERSELLTAYECEDAKAVLTRRVEADARPGQAPREVARPVPTEHPRPGLPVR